MANDRLARLYLKLIVVLALMVVAAVSVWRLGIPLGLDLRGGTELLYRIRTEELSEAAKRNVTQRTIDVIKKRIDPKGLMQPDIRPRGTNRFYIQLPGMGPEESRRIEDIIRRAGNLRFCLVNDDGKERMSARTGERVVGFVPFLPVYEEGAEKPKYWRLATYRELSELPAEVTNWLLVEDPKRARVTGEDLLDSHPTDDDTGMPAVGFRFRGMGRREFERLTAQNIGKKLAIILDEQLFSAPNIESRISGPGIIQGTFTQPEVDDLVATLCAGSLPADIELEWNNTVGAQLGEDSIRAGVRASVVAAILVVAFMMIYYLATGVVADFALTLNLLLVLGVMAGLQSVMTLPGIAGLVLTLGMAVDANVLINERIREERGRGKTLRLAISSGYERAFVTIIDSNLTTLITAFILFFVGTGPVKGFATTLMFGIVISMFTAIWVTRAIMDVLVERGWLKSLHMMRLIGTPNISFSRVRHLAMAASAVAIVAGLTVFGQRWVSRQIQDTDLTGGFRAEMELKEGLPIDEFRARVSAHFEKADVQSVWATDEKGVARGTPKRFSVRIRGLTDEQRNVKMAGDIEDLLKARGVFRSLAPVPENPWQFKVRLSEGLTERALREMLARERYFDSNIQEVVLEEKPTTDFILRLRSAALETKPYVQIARVLDCLDPLIVSQPVPIRIGELVERKASETRESETAPRAYVPIQLGAICSTVSVREAIVRDILAGKQPEELDVVGHGADAGAEKCREVAAYGSADVLRKIIESGKTELRVLPFSIPGPEELQISTEPPQKEADLRDRLSQGGILARKKADDTFEGLVRSVIPLGVQGDRFHLLMYELSEDKGVERIEQELRGMFEKEIASEEIRAEITPDEAPTDLAGREDSTEEGDRFFKLTFDRPLQMQKIQAALVRAGQRDALVGDVIRSEDAVATTDTVRLKLSGDAGAIREATRAIVFAFENPNPFRSIEAIGPTVAGEMRNKALMAVLLSCVAIVFYIWFRFGEVKFGLAAVVALVHDVLLTAGAVGAADALSGTPIGDLLGFSDIKVNVTMIAAFLTLIGYSINDTIVVFDRIRENMGGARRRVDAGLVDASVNQILSRTILTSFTTFMALVVLYIMGGPVIHGFAFVMAFGVLVGTYSSIFIASPILIGWESLMAGLRKVARIVTFRFD